MDTRWRACATAWIAGAGVVGVLDGLWQPGAGSALFLRESVAFAVAGAWLVSAGAMAIAALARRGRAPRRGTAFWLGAAIASAPLASAAGGAWGSPAGGVAAAAIAGGALLLAAPALGRRLAPPTAACAVLAVGLLLFLVAAVALPGEIPTAFEERWNPERDARPLPEGPDVVLISVDTLRADAVVDDPHADGDQSAPIAFLDGVRDEAAWAPFALASSNQTLPGHVGMLTGADAMAHGVRSNSGLPRADLPLLAEHFHEAGWVTGGVISNALLSPATGMHRGYDLYSDEPIALATYSFLLVARLEEHSWLGWLLPTHRTRALFLRAFFRDALANKERPYAERVGPIALRDLERLQEQPRPYFYFVHLMDPHTAYDPPEEYRGVLSGDLAPRVDARYLSAPDQALGVGEVRAVQEGLQSGDPEAETAAEYYHRVYLEEVMLVDAWIERIVTRARASGRPTVLLYTGDHGEQFGEHDLMDHANSLYEKNLQVPFLLWGDGVTPGRLALTPHLEDVAPTLLEAAGLAPPPSMTGRSLWSAATRAALSAEPRAHVAVDDKEIAVRLGSLKWVGRWSEEGRDPASVRLVDLDADPGEEHDLLDGGALPPALAAVIGDFVARDTWTPGAGSVSAAHQAALGQLGYAGQDDPRE